MYPFVNPVLPDWEYIPDPEVHVFGDRVYIYGSHDEFNGKMYCENDYVTWSAPVTDLSDWRYEGVIYRKTDHASPVKKGKTNMYAPDVAKGPDGKFYLYYSIADSSVISVAKSDSPTGPFSYYGDVTAPLGHTYGEDSKDWFEFDPAVLVDGNRFYLYSGSGQKANEKNGHPVVGLFVRELEPDMLTAKAEPKLLMPADDDRSEPNFFEGASIRKFDDWYYLLYMASDLTGLHYMMSRYPDRDFEHKGLLYSTSHNGMNDGASVNDAHIIENNHGSMEKISGEYYIFNHRHTNQSHFSRQVVGDKLQKNQDGTFNKAEYTSMGLRAEPFGELTTYPASMVCGLDNRKIVEDRPYISQEKTGSSEEPQSFVKGITYGSLLSYKSFHLPDATVIELLLRGKAEGTITLALRNKEQKSVDFSLTIESDAWEKKTIKINPPEQPFDLMITYDGNGTMDLKELKFN